jgi:hypothetical protein
MGEMIVALLAFAGLVGLWAALPIRARVSGESEGPSSEAEAA